MVRRAKLPLRTVLWPAKLGAACSLAWWLAPAEASLVAALFAALLVSPQPRFEGLQQVSRLLLLGSCAVVVLSVRALSTSSALALLLSVPLLAILLRRFRVGHQAPLAFLTAWWLCTQPEVGPELSRVLALSLASACLTDGLAALALAPWSKRLAAAQLRALARDLAETGESVASAVRQPDVRALRAADKRLQAAALRLSTSGASRALALRQACERLARLARGAIALRGMRLPAGAIQGPPPAGAVGEALTVWARSLRALFDGRPARPTGLRELAGALTELAGRAEQPALGLLAHDLQALDRFLEELVALSAEPATTSTAGVADA